MKINNSDSTAFAHSTDNKMDKIDFSSMNNAANNNNSHSNIDLHAVLANSNSQFMPKCPLCDKTFANSSNLKHHMNTIHFNEAKWICNECGKVCTSKSNLKVHLRVHLRVKPYYCRWCDYNCMHHSSIRDHLSKCHPEKSHNSCEPGYIFNSTAVPEPELSHFEPNTTILINNHDYDDTDQKSKKITNFTKVKRSLDNDYLTTNDQEVNEISPNNEFIKQEDQKLNFKRFKQDMEIDFNNKLIKKKKYLKKQRLREKILISYNDDLRQQKSAEDEDQEEHYNDHTNEENFNDEDDFTQTNRNTYFSDNDDKDQISKHDDDYDEQHNNELDSIHRDHDEQSLFIAPNKFNNSNQASTSSTSSTVSSSNSFSESKQFLKSPISFPFISHNIQQQQNDIFSALLSGLPLDNSNESTKSSNLNNLAAALIQRLSTVALMQQFNNKSNDNSLASLLSNQTEQLTDESFNSDKNRKIDDKNDRIKSSRSLNCALDLSIKTNVKKQRLEDVDNDEYISALSPVSTSSTNISNSSTKTSKSNDQQRKENQLNKLINKNEKEQFGKKSNKAILDVINRLNSNLPKPNQDDKLEQKNESCTKEEHNNNLDDLNDLIKSHLLPISEAAIEKYRDYFQVKKIVSKESAKETSETTNESVVSSLSSSPLSSSSHSSHFSSSSSSDYKCTFCNILKNLLDLHQFLHKI